MTIITALQILSTLEKVPYTENLEAVLDCKTSSLQFMDLLSQ